jgi:drug/metabolite transporter (DMT)-like permease
MERRGVTATCLATTWLVWGSTYLAIKFALLSFPPFFQMGTRFLVAGGLLLAWTRLRGRAMPTRTQWRNAATFGLLLGIWMGGVAYAEQSVASGLVVAFTSVVPAIVALMNLAFGLRPSRLETIGIAVGVSGVLLLTQGAGFAASLEGVITLAIACVSWSAGSVLSQRKIPAAPGAVGFASQMLCGGVFLMLMSWLGGESCRWPPQPQALLAWAYLVVFGSLIAFSAYMTLLARTGAVLASSYSFVNPVIGLFLGIAFGGETVTAYEWQAVAIIIAGVVLLVVGRSGLRSSNALAGPRRAV